MDLLKVCVSGEPIIPPFYRRLLEDECSPICRLIRFGGISSDNVSQRNGMHGRIKCASRWSTSPAASVACPNDTCDVRNDGRYAARCTRLMMLIRH